VKQAETGVHKTVKSCARFANVWTKVLHFGGNRTMRKADKTGDGLSVPLKSSEQSESNIHPAVEPLVVSPRGAGQMLDYGRKTIYRLMAEGHLVSFKDGKARKIVVASIHDHIKRRLEASAGSKLKRPT
jgi:hypothetical protein